MTWELRVLWATLFALALLGFTYKANAHEWFTDAKNPVTGILCCDGRDCKVLPDDESWWLKDGRVFVRWPDDGNVYSMPLNQAQPSQDKQGKAAACVLAGTLRCFFLPALF